MFLAEIAQALVEAINASSPENWGGSGSGLVVPDDLTAKFALDPWRDSRSSLLDIFVIPGFIEYDFSNRRSPPTAPRRSKFVTIAVSARIIAEAATPVYDITTETEAVKLIDLKEDLDEFVAKTQLGTGTDVAKVVSMDTEPANELELQDSFFVSVSVVEYVTC
jgi:hypothetical protein